MLALTRLNHSTQRILPTKSGQSTRFIGAALDGVTYSLKFEALSANYLSS
jgi:hypothetical protein